MKLWSESFEHEAPIPEAFAFGKRDAAGQIALAGNRSPHLAWSELPAGTRSLVLLCHDPDVPSRPDDVNQPGRRVPRDLPRVAFFHWSLLDIDPHTPSLPEGALSSGVTPRGKPGPDVPGHGGLRQGVNDYTGWFAGDPEMAGTYFGYDGPCPPWNDTLVHHYHFTLYALDVPRCPVGSDLSGAAIRAALAPHVLASATLMGTYTIAADAVDAG